jgi:phospholipase/lecithinase/hemolysin
MSRPDKLLVFGDSLSDSGIFYELSAAVLKVPVPPDSAGYNGWFSNGLVQSEVAAGLLGADLDNFAIGAARAIGSRTVQQYLDLNGYDTPEIMLPNPDPVALATDTYFNAQVGRYLASAAAHPPKAGTAASIWIGANDYNNIPSDATPELVAKTIADVVGNTIAAAAAIAQTGVEHVYIYNLPEPDFLPIPVDPAFTQIVALHNGGLAEGVEYLQSLGVEAEIVDMNRMSVEIDSDPRTFGLNPAYMNLPLILGVASQPTWVESTQNWYLPPNPLVANVDPDRVAFMDYLHPSSAMHGVLGSFAAASIAGSPIFGDASNEVIASGRCDDLILAGAGNDLVYSRGGADTVFAGLGDDFVWAGSGRDIVAGGAGNDVVHGGAGADVVAGSDGDDFQFGGKGCDLMVDGLGYDRIWGGKGSDAFLYTQASFLGGDNETDGGRFYGGRGIDTLYLALDDTTEAAVRAELKHGRASQHLDAIDVTTHSIERYVFVDPDDPASGIHTGARLAEADLWGIV